ncbi:MAG TPA: sulfotransferase [Mycobacteriales bacterium]|nr:sulfotransferase [Mycobacteriales bacterium]
MSEERAPLSVVRRTVSQLAATARTREGATFDPSQSPWFERAIFVTGAPRSGTSWLHQMLTTHPDVATAGEMHAFCEGLGEVFANFDSPDPYMNLSTWVTRPELVTLARGLVDGVLTGATRNGQDNAVRVLDKTPNHARTAALLAEVYPDATFVQIVRNPRDALSSARDLWSGWNARLRDWSASAADWCATVEDCRTHLGPLRYHEVQYEDLLADPVPQLTEILKATGLPYDEAFVADAVEFGKAPVNVRPSDQRISANKWADIDADAEQQIVEVAGDLMVELGYLDEAQRSAILSRRSARRTATTVRRGGERALRAASRRATMAGTNAAHRLRNRQTSESVMAVTKELIAAATRGDEVAARRLLAASAELSHSDGRTTRGPQAVAAELCLAVKDAQVIPFVADETAAAVEVVRPNSPRVHQRYYVARGLVTRIVIEGDRK